MEYETPITNLLNSWAEQPTGDDTAVFALVYDRLHDIAAAHFAKQGRHRVLQTTAVLNEAFLRLAKSRDKRWNNREHFFASSSRIMRHVLVDFAKESNRLKRGSGAVHITLDDPLLQDENQHRCDDVVAVHQALAALELFDPERAKLVELRYFAGMAPPEIADFLGLSESTVHRRWRMARAWLFDYLNPGN